MEDIGMAARPKVLVVRNDKLGDFVLALPACALLKQQWPEAEVVVLVPAYTQPVAELCPRIDRVLVDPAGVGAWALARRLRAERFDAVLTLFSTTRVGLAAAGARIPYRLAPATKLAQVFYNRRQVQRRSRSEQPEYMYNLDLARRLLQDLGRPVTDAPLPPYLAVAAERVAARREGFVREHRIASGRRLVFVHPGHGGSANNLSVAQYAELARALRSDARGHVVVISAGPGEAALGRQLSDLLPDVEHVRYESTAGLHAFIETLAFCDVFIGGSTGPLHLAGALDRPTAGFYPRRRSATSLRWQTLNQDSRRLAFSPVAGSEESDMARVDVERAAAQISARFLGASNAAKSSGPY